MQIRIRDTALFDGLERSAVVIATVLRMLVGLGLTVGLVLQVYMFVLTDLTCDAGSATLGNAIRCTSPLEMIAAAIFLVTGIGLASAFFSPRNLDLPQTVLMVLCGAVISFLAGLTAEGANWQTALVVLALFAAMGSLLVLRMFRKDSSDTDEPGTSRSDSGG